MRVVNEKQYESLYKKSYNFPEKDVTLKGSTVKAFAKKYEGVKRLRILIKSVLETLGTCFFGLFSEDLREDWCAVFTGKKVVAIDSSQFAAKDVKALFDASHELLSRKYHKMGLELLEKAAKQGYPPALFQLGAFHTVGYLVVKDPVKGKELMQKGLNSSSSG